MFPSDAVKTCVLFSQLYIQKIYFEKYFETCLRLKDKFKNVW